MLWNALEYMQITFFTLLKPIQKIFLATSALVSVDRQRQSSSETTIRAWKKLEGFNNLKKKSYVVILHVLEHFSINPANIWSFKCLFTNAGNSQIYKLQHSLPGVLGGLQSIWKLSGLEKAKLKEDSNAWT